MKIKVQKIEVQFLLSPFLSLRSALKALHQFYVEDSSLRRAESGLYNHQITPPPYSMPFAIE